jgi:hypothetical protein
MRAGSICEVVASSSADKSMAWPSCCWPSAAIARAKASFATWLDTAPNRVVFSSLTGGANEGGGIACTGVSEFGIDGLRDNTDHTPMASRQQPIKASQ